MGFVQNDSPGHHWEGRDYPPEHTLNMRLFACHVVECFLTTASYSGFWRSQSTGMSIPVICDDNEGNACFLSLYIYGTSESNVSGILCYLQYLCSLDENIWHLDFFWKTEGFWTTFLSQKVKKNQKPVHFAAMNGPISYFVNAVLTADTDWPVSPALGLALYVGQFNTITYRDWKFDIKYHFRSIEWEL